MSGKFLARASAIFLALLLVACGGDENSTPLAKTAKNSKDDAGSDGNNDRTPSELTPGIYATNITIDGEDDVIRGKTIISSSKQFATFVENDGATFGKLAIDGSSINGAGTYFPQSGANGIEGNIKGDSSSSDNLSLNISAPNADYKSEAELSRKSSLSDTYLSKEQLTGSYLMPSTATGSDQLTITISESGKSLKFTGNYGSPCRLDGRVIIPDTKYNVFEATYTASNCTPDQTPNGDFKGLGYVDEKTLTFIGTNKNIYTYFIGDK